MKEETAAHTRTSSTEQKPVEMPIEPVTKAEAKAKLDIAVDDDE